MAGFIEPRVRNLALLKTRLVEGLVYVKSVQAQSLPTGMVWKIGEETTRTQVPSSSFDRGSKLRSPLPISLLLFPSRHWLKSNQIKNFVSYQQLVCYRIPPL
ncbi:hypothetical protein TNCV_1379741 [Trichonephila clavipes]|nr:hypothetical protein TNCV_1379741 [Trichonephila clavipes]